MLGKIITFPFWIICRILGMFTGILKIAFGILRGIVRFLFSHILGTILGALIGFFLGRKHLGVKVFTHKIKWPWKK